MEQVDEQHTEDIVVAAPEPEKSYTQADIDAMKSEWEQRLSESQTALQKQTVQHAFYKKATELGVANAEKLLQYVDMSKVTFDDAGQPQGIDEIIETLTAAVPKAVAPKTIGGPSGFPNVDKSPQSMLHEAAERARKTGRVEDRAAFSALKQKITGGR